MPQTHVPLSTIYEIRDQIMARIRPVIDDAISEAATSVAKSIPAKTKVPSTPIPELGAAHWIWTNEQPYGNPPDGPRALRKVEVIPDGEFVDSMVIDIAFHRYHTLYVNGHVVGSSAYPKPTRYSIKFPSTDRVVITVYGYKYQGDEQAGLIASAVMWSSTNYAGRTFVTSTDGAWVTSIDAIGRGFEKLHYAPDSSWSRARVLGAYGMNPWGNIGKPSKTDGIQGGIEAGSWLCPPRAPFATAGPPPEGIV